MKLKTPMDEHDTGYIEYDNRFPPICIRPYEIDSYDVDAEMSGIVLQYLRESHREGIKHPNTVLPSGITVGEAAVYHLKDTHNNKQEKKDQPRMSKSLDIFQKLMEVLEQDMDINMTHYEQIFIEYVNPDLFCSKNVDSLRLLHSIKAFLTRIDKKDKGYTLKLNNSVHRFFATVLDTKM